MGNHKQVEVMLIRSEQIARLTRYRVKARLTSEVTAVTSVDQDGNITRLHDDALAVLRVAHIEKMIGS